MIFVAFLFTTIIAFPLQVNTETNQIIDEYGRERFFHGLNVIQKTAPYHPNLYGFDANTTFSEIDMQYWREWGFNIVRLGTQWPGYEPEEGQFNNTYLDILEQIVNNGAKYGIYTLLDFHQDVLSPKFCGEGLPAWATDVLTGVLGTPFPSDWSFGLSEDQIPTQTQCSQVFWTLYQTTVSGAYAYQQLYDNANGIWDKFAGFWKAVAGKFEQNDFVVGYELLNEPFNGNFYANPLRKYVSGYTDYHSLQPMYDYLNDQIRTVDDSHLIFFEPVQTDLSTEQTGFTHVPGGLEYADRSVLSFHYYDPPNGLRTDHFKSRREDTQRLNTGGMLTEFAVMHDNYVIDGGINQGLIPTPEELAAEIAENPGYFNTTHQLYNIEIADEYLFSWIGWEYKIFTPITGAGPSVWNFDGTKNDTVIATLTRTYPQAVAGLTQSFSFNNATAEFNLNFTSNDITNNEVTEIYLHEAIHYPSGFNLEFLGSEASRFNSTQEEKNYLRVSTVSPVPWGSTVGIRITSN